MVKAWRETVVIPTYEAGAPEKNPIFLEKRVYQGSSGVVYPYPVIESIADEKHDKEYQAVWLENEYIRVMVLPHDFGDFRIPQFLQPDSADGCVIILRPRQIVQKSSTVDEIGIQHSPLLFERRAKLVGKCRRGLTVGDQILIRSGCFEQGKTDYTIQVWFT